MYQQKFKDNLFCFVSAMKKKLLISIIIYTGSVCRFLKELKFYNVIFKQSVKRSVKDLI